MTQVARTLTIALLSSMRGDQASALSELQELSERLAAVEMNLDEIQELARKIANAGD
jgi:N6-adenosine-specific RNA methylase IME4